MDMFRAESISSNAARSPAKLKGLAVGYPEDEPANRDAKTVTRGENERQAREEFRRREAEDAEQAAGNFADRLPPPAADLRRFTGGAGGDGVLRDVMREEERPKAPDS